jgi:DNA-binding NtrC family response regulator
VNSSRPLGAVKGGESLTGTTPPPETSDKGTWLQKMIDDAGSLSELKKQIEFEAIASALREEKGNITRAAKRLGMKRPRLSQIIHSNPRLGELKQGLTESE